jgi:hypothetical protein
MTPSVRLRTGLPLLLGALSSALVLGHSSAGAEEAPSAKPILPGYWSYTASTVLPGANDGKQCVRPDKIDEFMSGPHNHHYKCTYPSRRVAEGEAAFDGECVGKRNEHYHISVTGTYSLKAFALKGHIKGVILGLPLTLPISIDAKWVGAECPAGAPGA